MSEEEKKDHVVPLVYDEHGHVIHVVPPPIAGYHGPVPPAQPAPRRQAELGDTRHPTMNLGYAGRQVTVPAPVAHQHESYESESMSGSRKRHRVDNGLDGISQLTDDSARDELRVLAQKHITAQKVESEWTTRMAQAHAEYTGNERMKTERGYTRHHDEAKFEDLSPEFQELRRRGKEYRTYYDLLKKMGPKVVSNRNMSMDLYYEHPFMKKHRHDDDDEEPPGTMT